MTETSRADWGALPLNRSILVATACGLLTVVALIIWQGAGTIFGSLRNVGWAIVPVVSVHVAQMIFAALGWRTLDLEPRRAPVRAFLLARWIREAASNLLPFSQIGGEFVGARVLTFYGANAGEAGARVVVDLTMEVVTQFVFTLAGIALLLLTRPGDYGPVVQWTAIGLCIMVPGVFGFIVAQRRGMFLVVERLFEWLAGKWPALSPGALEGMHQAIQAIYQRPRALIASCLLHTLSWVAGAVEVWLILYLIGSPVRLSEAFVLESLGQAVRSAAFMIPGGLGAQEGAFLLLGGLYGLPPGVGLALSLVKRVREVLLGVPALAAWHFIESKRLWVGGRSLGAGQEEG